MNASAKPVQSVALRRAMNNTANRSRELAEDAKDERTKGEGCEHTGSSRTEEGDLYHTWARVTLQFRSAQEFESISTGVVSVSKEELQDYRSYDELNNRARMFMRGGRVGGIMSIVAQGVASIDWHHRRHDLLMLSHFSSWHSVF